MTSDKGAVNDSIDELLDGVPADPMLPKKRARSIEEVKAAQAAPPSGRRLEDKVVIREGSDPRERARLEAERAKRESSTFGTSFLQRQANRTRWVVGALVSLGVLAIYFFVRHGRHKEEITATTTPTASVQVTHVLSASAVPLTAGDLPPPPTTTETIATTASATPTSAPHAGSSHGTKSSHSADVSAAKPPPPVTPPAPSSSNARTDVARSL